MRYVFNAHESLSHVSKGTCSARNVSIPISVSVLPRVRDSMPDSRPVTQLSDIKRQKVKLETLKREAEEERQKARELEEAKLMCSIENKEACLMCSG